LRCQELVRALLSFSRTQAKPERTAINLTDAVNEVCLLISAQTKMRRVVLEKSLADNLPAVMANKNQIQQMILNLANNAMDAMPEGGTLRFTSERRAGKHHATLRVTDSGSGMTADVKAKIFEPFFTTKGEGKGTGLGLALVFDMVHQHAGEIEVDSAPGQGTSFAIHLPLA
jgi:signal transduction histidine kinase